MGIIILILVGIGIFVFIILNVGENKEIKEHRVVKDTLTPIARKFDLNPDGTLTKRIIDEAYNKKRKNFLRNAKINFLNLDDLDRNYKELLRLAERLDCLEDIITPGRRREFYD